MSQESLFFNLIGIVIILSVISYLLLSRLIKVEHDDYYDAWEKDGKPHGMPFYFPKDTGGFTPFGTNPWRKGYQWLFKKPDWIRDNTKALQLLKYFRLTQFIAWFIILGDFLILIIQNP